jgi:zinc protease
MVKLSTQRIALSNGLVILLAENHALPTVSVNLVVKTGERYLSDEQAGLGNLAGELLDQGTDSRTALGIATEIEAVGGVLETVGGYGVTTISTQSLSDDLDLCLELAADVTRNAQFPDEKVEQETSRVLAEIQARRDDPRVIASEAFDEIIFAGTPQHRPLAGYEETVAAITRDNLREYHRQRFAPNNSLIAIAGDFTAEAVIRKIEGLFGDWKRNAALKFPEVRQPQRQTEPMTRFIVKDKEQVNIYLGHVGIERKHPDYATIRVMDTILGDSPGFTSRIPRILRDEQGLAYTTYCHMARSAGLDAGRFVAFIGTAPDNLKTAVNGLREQIELLHSQPPTADEVRAAKEYLTGSYVFEFETNAQMAGYMIRAELHDLPASYPEDYLSEIRRVTPEDVFRVTRRHIAPDKMTLVIVGPVSERSEEGQGDGETGR